MKIVIIVQTVITVLLQNKALGLEVRLNGGPSKRIGRVEVYHDGIWGAICDDNWDDNVNCLVVCTQLHYRSGAKFPVSGKFGDWLAPIMLDDVQCHGNEVELSHCIYNNFYDHDCTHKEDVACVCEHKINIPDEKEWTRKYSATCRQPSHRITPVNAEIPWVGRAEVHLNGRWMAICEDNWDELDVIVFCNCIGISNDTKNFNVYQNPQLEILPYMGLAYDSVDCTEADTEIRKNIWDCPNTRADGACRTALGSAGVACGILPNVLKSESPTVLISCGNNRLDVCFPSNMYILHRKYITLNPLCVHAGTRGISIARCVSFDLLVCTASRIMSNNFERTFCYDIAYNPDIDTSRLNPGWKREACCHQKRNLNKAMGLFIHGDETDMDSRPHIKQGFNPPPPKRFNMACHLDSSYPSQPINKRDPGADIFCLMGKNYWAAGLALIVPKCNFYGDHNGIAQFNFERNKCPSANILRLHLHNLETKIIAIQFKSQRWREDNGLSISCQAYVCDPWMFQTPICIRGCSHRDLRGKRDANGMDEPISVKVLGDTRRLTTPHSSGYQ